MPVIKTATLAIVVTNDNPHSLFQKYKMLQLSSPGVVSGIQHGCLLEGDTYDYILKLMLII